MKKTLSILLGGLFVFSSCNEELFIEPIRNIDATINPGEAYTYNLFIDGTEDSVEITLAPINADTSEFFNDSTLPLMRSYKYVPDSTFIGEEIIEMSITRNSDYTTENFPKKEKLILNLNVGG